MDTMAFALLSIAFASPQEQPIEVLQYRFPPKEIASEAMKFNRAYRVHLTARQVYELHNYWEIQEAITETDYLFHCWDWLAAGQGGEGRDESYWRTSFERLKELIGDEAFNAGRMPPNVPYHRFSYIN
jgi:hypothetical protein